MEREMVKRLISRTHERDDPISDCSKSNTKSQNCNLTKKNKKKKTSILTPILSVLESFERKRDGYSKVQQFAA